MYGDQFPIGWLAMTTSRDAVPLLPVIMIV
jgi:hypothetical protein